MAKARKKAPKPAPRSKKVSRKAAEPVAKRAVAARSGPRSTGRKPPRGAKPRGRSGAGGKKRPSQVADLMVAQRADLTTSHTGKPVRATEPLTPSRAFAIAAARLMHDDKCEEVVVLDVRQLCQVSDYIVVGSGTSDRQMRAVASHLKQAGASQGYTPFRSDIDDTATWCLVDFVDVVAHVFEPNTRSHYDLEMLWGDAKRVPWEREGDQAAGTVVPGLARGRSQVVSLPG